MFQIEFPVFSPRIIGSLLTPKLPNLEQSRSKAGRQGCVDDCEPARKDKMSTDPFSHKENVVCRVCEKKMLARNYKRHLIDHHKGDLGGKTQRPVNQFLDP